MTINDNRNDNKQTRNDNKQTRNDKQGLEMIIKKVPE